MKVSKSILVGLSLWAMVSHAEVTLNVDDNVKVTAINGEAISHGLFTPAKRNFKLEEGQHVITARYERLFDLSGDNHDVIRSKDITVTATLMDNQSYRLTMPNQPNRYDDAKEYAKKPSLAIVQGDTVVSQQTATASQGGGLLSGIGAMFGRGQNSVTANQKAIQAVQTQPQVATPAPTKATTTLDKFMELWLSANESEREKIRQWVQK